MSLRPPARAFLGLLVSIAMPAALPAGAAPLVIDAGQTFELAPGVHSFDSITIHPAGTLKLLGHTTLNVAGDVLLLRETDPAHPFYYRHASIMAQRVDGVSHFPWGASHGPEGWGLDGGWGESRPRVAINSGGSILVEGALVGVGGGNLSFLSGDGGNASHGRDSVGPPNETFQAAGDGGHGGFAGDYAATIKYKIGPDISLNAAHSIIFDGRSLIEMWGGAGGRGGDGGEGTIYDPSPGGRGGHGGNGGDGADVWLQARDIQLIGNYISLNGGRGGHAGDGGNSAKQYWGGRGGDGGLGGRGGNLVLRGFEVTNTMTFHSPGGEGGDRGYGGWSEDAADGVDGMEGLPGVDGIVVIQHLTQQPGLSNGDFFEGLALFRQSGRGTAAIVELNGNPVLEMSTGDDLPTETISLNLSQFVSTVTDLPSLLLEFDYRFLSDAGMLEVLLDEIVLVSLAAVQSADFTRYSALLDDPALMGLDVAELHLRLHPGSLATVQLDNLVFQPNAEAPILPGDANLDGRVDGEDFLIWQASFGTQSGAAWDDGDFNGDGRVDGEDFLIWQANFGRVAESSAIAPEPSAMGLLCVWMSGLLRRRHPIFTSSAAALHRPAA